MPWMMTAQDQWRDERGVKLLDGGAPWYDVYEAADGGWLAVGALEAPFYAALLAGLELADVPDRDDPANWPKLRTMCAARFKQRTRDQWALVFAGSDACVEPVLSLHEATQDEHLAARRTYLEQAGLWQPAPAPRRSARRLGNRPRPGSERHEGCHPNVTGGQMPAEGACAAVHDLRHR